MKSHVLSNGLSRMRADIKRGKGDFKLEGEGREGGRGDKGSGSVRVISRVIFTWRGCSGGKPPWRRSNSLQLLDMEKMWKKQRIAYTCTCPQNPTNQAFLWHEIIITRPSEAPSHSINQENKTSDFINCLDEMISHHCRFSHKEDAMHWGVLQCI